MNQRSSSLATPLPLSLLPPSSSSVQFFYSTTAQAGLQDSRKIAGGREIGGTGEELQEDYSSDLNHTENGTRLFLEVLFILF